MGPPVGSAVTFAVLVWRLGAGPFLDGIRTIDGRSWCGGGHRGGDHRVLRLAVAPDRRRGLGVELPLAAQSRRTTAPSP